MRPGSRPRTDAAPNRDVDPGATPGPPARSWTGQADAPGTPVRYYRLDAAGAPRPCSRSQWIASAVGDDGGRLIEVTCLWHGPSWAKVVTLFCGVESEVTLIMYQVLVCGGPCSGVAGDYATAMDARMRHIAEVERLQHLGYRIVPTGVMT